jgi:CheY-like chemotaxis protein
VDEFITKPLFRSRIQDLFINILEGKPNDSAKNYLSDIMKLNYKDKKILVAEDNDLNREIAKEIIEMAGVKVDTACNGKEAVEMLKNSDAGTYDIIFMDIQMPLMNGYEAAAAIRNLDDNVKAATPIIAMTANAFAEDVILAKNAGMNEHMAKPIDINKLNDILKKWL